MINYSKCKNCGRVLEINKLEKINNEYGYICIDKQSCKKKIEKN